LAPRLGYVDAAFDHATQAPQPAQIALQQEVDVDIHGIRLEQTAGDHLLAQYRNARQRRSGVEPQGLYAERADLLETLVEQSLLGRGAYRERATRGQYRSLGEALGRLLEKRAARQCQGPDLRRPVALEIERRGATRRVVTRLRLPLEQDDPTVAREVVADRDAGDTRADDDPVTGFGLHRHPDSDGCASMISTL